MTDFCNNCYHLTEQIGGSFFCFAEGLISRDKQPKNHCDLYLDKYDPPQLCPDCTAIYRKRSEFCKHCKIIKLISSKAMDENQRIGNFSLKQLEEIDEMLKIIKNEVNNHEIFIILEEIIHDLKGNFHFYLVKQRIKDANPLLEKIEILTLENQLHVELSKLGDEITKIFKEYSNSFSVLLKNTITSNFQKMENFCF